MGGGHICLPCVFAYICGNTRTRGVEIFFPSSKFRIGQYAFYPVKLSGFAEIRSGSEAPPTSEKLLNSIIFGTGFCSSKLHESF